MKRYKNTDSNSYGLGINHSKTELLKSFPIEEFKITVKNPGLKVENYPKFEGENHHNFL